MTPPSSFDIGFVVDRLGDLPEVETVEFQHESVQLRYQNKLIRIRFVDTHRGGRWWMNGGDVDRLFVLLDDNVLEVDEATIYSYELQSVDSEEVLVERFANIFTETAERQPLSWNELADVLAASDLSVIDTPRQVAEIIAGWAVTDSSDSVLDIATGTGTVLSEAADQLNLTIDASSRCVGIDADPFACALARNRLQDIEAANLINTNFFEWNLEHDIDGEQATLTDTEGEVPTKFDAVVGAPPAVRLEHLTSEQRDQLQNWSPSDGRQIGGAYVAKAVTHLKDGGRAAFILPQYVLRDGLIDHLTQTCALHRIVALPLGAFTETRKGFEAVVVSLVKEDRSPEVRETGVAKFNGMELPDNARGLFEQPLDGILANRYNTFNAEIVKAAHNDLDGENLMRLLSSPSIYDVLTAGCFTRLGDLGSDIEVGSGVTSGNNELFYFDPEERDVSGIDDRFFRPLIENLSDDTQSITADEIDQYVLDLQPYLDELPGNATPETDREIIEHLDQNGYDNLVEYLQSAETRPNRTNRSKSSFTLQRRGKFQNPDLVLPEFFDEPQCYTVEVDDAMFESTVIGIRTATQELKVSLQRLLNTPLYSEFLSTFGSPVDVNWYRINLRELRDVPVIEEALTAEVAEKLDAFLPPSDNNDVIGANQVLIEACPTDEAEQAFQQYMASRDDYAWSWFLTLSEIERFQELVDKDRKKAQEFIIERFDRELLDKARQTFNQLEFFEHRRDLLNDLLMEFESNHYRSFLAGITLQFEGILTDLVLKSGGDIVNQNGETKFKLPGENRSQQKNLNNLISTFFDGIFSTFMHENIRQRRNAIAHGDVIEDDQDLAVHFFIAFYALCYASLAEYTRQTTTDRMT
ncbi:HsdM family class I SAM-dependent methyltransferase [Natranaeroarchaeum aerophilus]|uniref:SAM-dependent methyltransferase n=1 Tax=Natranaeroarchaeum aerophilus TaxID=2917711 RepID=A0AAE3FNH4_9EURY|nr:N-6 DNA methylase [Natranaeroarchaeum aerophilus]MCL9812255.1 SAM-dependent methyltransferase [Natranaeroarchaeum aerophilus]